MTRRTLLMSLLLEGTSMRAASRVVGVSINTVTKLLADIGDASQAFHDRHVRGVRSSRIELDEIWSFNYTRTQRLHKAKAPPPEAGDIWTWTALDPDSRLTVAWAVGR